MKNQVAVGIKFLNDAAVVPAHSSECSAGADVRATNSVVIMPGESAVIETGLSFDIPKGFMIEVVGRSGLGFNKGIRLANCVGIIDEDYKGELKLKLTNDGNESFAVNVGDRVGQILLREYFKFSFEVVGELTESARGTGGFGSTGIK